MDPIKEAFNRAKQDILELKAQLTDLTISIQDIKRTLDEQRMQQTNHPTNQQTEKVENNSIQHINPTDVMNPTHKMPLESLKSPILSTSTGNRGVPTDKQTNQQTDRQTYNPHQIGLKAPTNSLPAYPLGHVSEVIQSLDSIKKELRYTFKHLTNQEMQVFSTLYTLQEEQNTVDYPLIASKLNLSESSIRDYIQKIIKKGIPIQKTKENNKKIYLSLPSEFKRLASLQTLLALREL